MRRAAKVDATQDQIVSTLRAAGAMVQSLAAVGKGCPDLLVSHRQRLFLMECKAGRGKLNEAQEKWHAEWKTPVYVVRDAEQALLVLSGVVA